MPAHIEAFFDPATFTYSYVISDPATRRCAIVDSVLDYDPAAGRTSGKSADRLIGYVREQGLSVDWLLETHVHADHLSAAAYLKRQLGGQLGIGEQIAVVQNTFAKLFNSGREFATDGSQFDRLFADGERFQIGSIEARAIHTPGHTPACLTYVIGDAAFVGDTLFMPDYGTARCDFPGGDARLLFRSIHKLFALPVQTRLFMCHDYKAPGREEFCNETTVAEQRAHNVHVHEGVDEDDFVAMRRARDASLDMPSLILPSVQVNMRAGQLPPAEDNGTRYLKIPLDVL
ncbi:MBL fold metallo-hydrolase [Pseudomonas sp. sp1636]|uniref:MBL fold metallo-hydrolase n=1 Tax=Pseudomonas sp. sp1636 TaxID=3036707 RepID=UPI0025A4CD62|nr:MBL fold metallo-hydrolase [Pseudomonas sp. sp1636]MDM8348714.1 MBL fold metallo-hydrolase [Pseudomonas sp. sp1636]